MKSLSYWKTALVLIATASVACWFGGCAPQSKQTHGQDIYDTKADGERQIADGCISANGNSSVKIS